MQVSLLAAPARPVLAALPRTCGQQRAAGLRRAPWQRGCTRTARARASPGGEGATGGGGEAAAGGGASPSAPVEFKEEDWPHIKWAMQEAGGEQEPFCEQPEITVRLADAGFYMSYDEDFLRPITVRAADGLRVTYRDLRAALEAERAPDVGHCRLEGVDHWRENEFIARFEQSPQ